MNFRKFSGLYLVDSFSQIISQLGFAISGSRDPGTFSTGIQYNPRNLGQYIFDKYSPHFIDANPL